MKVNIASPEEPLLIELETLLKHRFIVRVNGQDIVNIDIPTAICAAFINGQNVTRIDIET